MNSNPKNFTPDGVEKSQNAQNEEKILQFWRDNNIFQKTLKKPPAGGSPIGDYNFFEGPPTANGRPGIHHVLARSFKDIIPRYKTMRGFHARRKAGWDTHGLPVELQVEKALGLKTKKEVEEYGVAEFNEKCKESVWTYKDEWEVLTDRMGYWLDMNNPYTTYDNSYIEALWATVKKIDERGHLYRDFRVGPWCTRCETGLASHELNQPGAYKDIKDLTAYVKFKVKPGQKIGEFETDDNTYIMAWTTTPWTLPGNIALAVGGDIEYVRVSIPRGFDFSKIDIKTDTGTFVFAKEATVKNDELHKLFWMGTQEGCSYEITKGSNIQGLQYQPLYPFMQNLADAEQQEKMKDAFQVYTADFVTTTDGTGVVHIAPMYGADDFNLGTENNLPKFHVVNQQGKYIDGCDTETLKLSGRYVKEKDDNGKPTLAVDIIDDLTACGLLFKKENYAHSYPHCWRCDTPLLYFAQTSWYFRMSQLRDQLLQANKTINWEPDHIRDGRFGEWLDGVKDWAISRNRYWGTPLPVWQTESGKRVVIGGLDDIKKYSKKSGNKYFVARHGQAQSNVNSVWDFAGDPENHLTDLGKSQAAEAGQKISSEKIDVIISSPILRTQETARIIAEQIGYDPEKIIIDKRVIEWQVGGDFQGKNLDEYLKIRNSSLNRYTFKAEGGESFAELIKRCGEFLHDIESRYQGKNILIVSHNSTARGLTLASEGFNFEMLLKNPPKEYPFANAEIREIHFSPLPHNENYELDFHKPYIDNVALELDGEKLIRTPEVMDVWFDSGAMPIAQDHVLGSPINFDPIPADYISEGADQTRGWFYTMHAIANLLHDNPTVTYKNVVCLGLLMAADGTKMSKSKGNIVSPWEIFEKFGADVARFWFYSVNAPGETKNFDEKSLDEVNKKVFNILRNVVSFYEMYRDESIEEKNISLKNLNVLDAWIFTRLMQVTQTVTESLDQYDMVTSSRSIKDFIDDLSTWYVRRSRERLKDGDTNAKQVFYVVLMRLAKIMAPFTPFIAEEIYQKLRHIDRDAESVHMTEWPDYVPVDQAESMMHRMDTVRKLVTLGLEARQRANIKVRQPLVSITISESLPNDYLEILKDELNIKSVVINESLTKGTVELDTTITDDLRDEGDMRELIRIIQDMRKIANLIPSDYIQVSLNISQPAWFITNQKLHDELLQTVGAKEIVWGARENKIEKV